MNRWFVALAASLACCLTQSANAQWWDNPWMGGFHASTPAEGYARGMADLTRSAGMANLLDAQAAIAAEQARTLDLQNDVMAVETYFNKKAINRANREANRRPPRTTDQLAMISRARTPDPLGIEDFDPVSGEIHWPIVLRDDGFSAYRKRLDELFAARAERGGELTLDDARAIQDVTAELLSALKARIREFPSSAYLQARNFVTSLSFEGRV